MALLTQTAANVGVGSLTATTRAVQVGEAVTQGQPGYRAADGKYYIADADDADKIAVACIFLTPAGSDGYSVVLLLGLVNLGATLTVGVAYYLSATVGRVQLESDLATGDYVTFLGIAKTAALLDFNPQPSGVQVP